MSPGEFQKLTRFVGQDLQAIHGHDRVRLTLQTSRLSHRTEVSRRLMGSSAGVISCHVRPEDEDLSGTENSD